MSAEQKAQRAANLANTDTAVSRAKTVGINAKTFRVAHVTKRNQALVELVGTSTPYFAADIEAASHASTGCKGRFDAGILAFVGGSTATVDLAELRTKFRAGLQVSHARLANHEVGNNICHGHLLETSVKQLQSSDSHSRWRV